MKKSRFLKLSGFGLLTLTLLGVAVFLFLSKSSSSKQIVLVDEAKEHSIMLHNANGDHACDCFQPWISNVTISNIKSTSVDVTWDCSDYLGAAGPATYQVTYGTTTSKSSIYPAAQPTVAYTHYTVSVPNLTANTLYHIGVRCCCLSNCSRGGGPNVPKTYQQSPHVDDWTVTTSPASTTYTISGTISNGAATITGVIVTLSGGASKKDTTAADGIFSFAGLTAGTYTITPAKAGMTFNPVNKTVNVTNANQTAQNFAGTATAVVNQVAERALMSGVTVAKVTAKDVTITWKTNLPATSMVEYGLTTEYGMKSGVNAETGYNHYIQLFELRKGSTYHARAVSYAGANTSTASYSSDFTFKVPAFEDRIADRNRIINEPNPATTWTMFSYYLYQPTKSVTIDIMTLSGKLMATLKSPSSSLAEGWNKVRWDNINLENGLYVYRMKFVTPANQEEEMRFSSLRITK